MDIFYLGAIEILGRPLKIQQKRKAYRPVRDVSRLTVMKNKTNRSAKSREEYQRLIGISLSDYAGFMEQPHFAPANRCFDRRHRA